MKGEINRLKGEKVFKEALVPLKAGDLVVPAVKLVFFDPRKGDYVESAVGPFELKVLPSKGKEELKLTEVIAPGGGKLAVKVLGKDILPIHKGLEGLEPQVPGALGRALAAACLFLPPAAYVVLLVALRRRDRLEKDQALRRRRKAFSRAKKALARAGRLSGRERAEAVSKALKEYVGDMLDLEGGALTAGELGSRLAQSGVPDDLARQAKELASELEEAIYGGMGRADKTAELRSRAVVLVRRLHKHLDKNRVARRDRT